MSKGQDDFRTVSIEFSGKIFSQRYLKTVKSFLKSILDSKRPESKICIVESSRSCVFQKQPSEVFYKKSCS